MSERRDYLRGEIAWLEQHLTSLKRDQKRLRYLGFLALLSVPAGFVWGVLGAVAAIVGTLVLLGMGTYLVYGHQTEYEDKIAALRRELKALD